MKPRGLILQRVLLTAATLSCVSLLASASLLAQTTTNNPNNPQHKPPPAKVVTPAVAPKFVAPAAAAKPAPTATTTAAPKFVNPNPGTGPKFVNPNAATGPKIVGPAAANPAFTGQKNFQHHTGPTGPSGNAARAVAIRGANRTTIAGQNFSIRRGSYRSNRNGYWRTFAGVGTLSAILYAGYRYYPYAYIDAPPELCEGETEDGCQLQWQPVQTLEGPMDAQCVAYCPWQQ